MCRRRTSAQPDARASAQLLELFDQFAHRAVRQAGDCPVGVPDRAVAVDDEDTPTREAERTERSEQSGDRLVGVGEQRKLEAVLAGERLMAVDRLRRDPDDLRVELMELVES